MKVILLQDISNLGKKGEIKEVSNGYARNFLIPKGLAIPATNEAVRRIEKEKEEKEARTERDAKKKKSIAKAINNTRFEIKVKVGEKGHLYGSVTPTMISEKLKSQGFEVNPADIVLERPIKEAGEYSIKIDFGDNITANIKVTIVPE